MERGFSHFRSARDWADIQTTEVGAHAGLAADYLVIVEPLKSRASLGLRNNLSRGYGAAVRGKEDCLNWEDGGRSPAITSEE